MSIDSPEISVILSTYNRADVLPRTLQHLAQQDLAPDRFEVVIVDDGSPDDTQAVVERLIPTLPFKAVYRRHENRGPGYTQNRGIEIARAPIVLLMADDILLAPEAVRLHLEHHRARPEKPVAVLGRVVQSPDLSQSVFLAKWDPFRFGELEGLEELPTYRFWAMNISAKRAFLVENGMYLEHKGRGGASCLEDLELGYRLRSKGLRLYYSQGAWGYHYHVVTLDQATRRWYERGLNYGEFRRHAQHPELTVWFHVLDRHTIREYRGVLSRPNGFTGRERYFAWHVLRHFARVLTMNAVTAKLVWRPLFDLAERRRALAAIVKPKMYRAFLYYHFLRGVRDGRRIYGD